MNECLPQNPCTFGGTCQNTNNGFNCICPDFRVGKVCQLGKLSIHFFGWSSWKITSTCYRNSLSTQDAKSHYHAENFSWKATSRFFRLACILAHLQSWAGAGSFLRSRSGSAAPVFKKGLAPFLTFKRFYFAFNVCETGYENDALLCLTNPWLATKHHVNVVNMRLGSL